MLSVFIFLTLCLAIFLILGYMRHRSKAELFYSLLISNILLLFVSLLHQRSHPNFIPMTIFLTGSIVFLFIVVGGKYPLRRWSELRCEVQKNLFSGQHYKVGNFTDFIDVNKIILYYVRQRSSLAILAVVITGLLFGIWFVIQYYVGHSNIGQ